MPRHRRAPVAAVMTVILVAVGLATTFRAPTNPASLPGGLTVSLNAESTALYCAGLPSTTHRPGRVTFYNTSEGARTLAVSVVSNEGHVYTTTLELAAHTAQSIQPAVVDQGDSFAVAVQVSGGGVVGEEIAGTDRAEAPCASHGVTSWYATGFDTLVGSSAVISVYNPTATAAVFNTSIYSAGGFSAPQSFQGVSVPAHTQIEVNLGAQVVDTSNVGVGIKVIRGLLVFTGVEESHDTLSLDQGSTTPSSSAWFPNVTTATAATAALRVANPGDRPATVTVAVDLGAYRVRDQVVTVAPFSSGVVVITPNSAIPAAGYADLTLRSSEPVVADLATGTASGSATSVALVAPVAPDNAFLVYNFTSLGFDAATVTNTSSRAVKISVADDAEGSTTVSVAGGVTLAAHATMSLAATEPDLKTSSKDAYLVSTTRPVIVVGLTLPSRPAGVNVVAPLNGR